VNNYFWCTSRDFERFTYAELIGVTVMFCIRVRKVLGSEGIHGFPQSSKANVAIAPRLVYDSFYANSLIHIWR
jgi:hypothetical protein